MKKLLTAAALAAFAISGHAALENRDLNHDGFTDAFYDTDLNITWLRDANYALTSGTDNDGAVDGLMSWAKANAWADSVTFGGYTDWRLPTMTLPQVCTIGVTGGCTNSEMGHLFYTELGNKYNNPHGSNSFKDFLNVQGSAAYWSDTPRTDGGRVKAYDFLMHSGTLGDVLQSSKRYAMLVRPGDVSAVAGPIVTPVPEPETYAMLLAGLGLIGAVARRRQAK